MEPSIDPLNRACVGIKVYYPFIMYNIQKYRVPKDSQCLKGSDYSLHDRSNSTPGKLHRRTQSLTSQGTGLQMDQSHDRLSCQANKT